MKNIKCSFSGSLYLMATDLFGKSDNVSHCDRKSSKAPVSPALADSCPSRMDIKGSEHLPHWEDKWTFLARFAVGSPELLCTVLS